MKKLLGGLCLLPMACIIMFIVYHATDGDLLNVLYIILYVVGLIVVAILTCVGLALLEIIG